MASFLARSLVLGCGLILVILAVGGLPPPGSAMGLPRPQPNLNFTIGVEGVVWCKSCRYRGYVESRDASPLRSKSVPSFVCTYVLIVSIDFQSFLTTVYMRACRRRGAAAVPARPPGAVGVEHHERARLLPDPDGDAGGPLHAQQLQGVRAAVAGARVPRGRQPRRPEEGVAAQVPQVRHARRRPAGALLRRPLHVRAAGPIQVLITDRDRISRLPKGSMARIAFASLGAGAVKLIRS